MLISVYWYQSPAEYVAILLNSAKGIYLEYRLYCDTFHALSKYLQFQVCDNSLA